MTHVPLTAALGDFVANLRYEDIPATAVAIAKQGIADCVGVMLAGSAEPAVAAVRRGFAPDTAGGGSSICFGPERAPAHVAAWVNGTAAHVLDYDDVALKGSHPSAVLVPAILAEAEAVGASGRDMLRAYAAGFETWGELISRDRGNYQRKGWHPTGVFGAVGAAAACAALRGATAQEAAHALGIAASQASGVMANLGFMTKPMHAGKAAACGLLAARFAAAGLTAAPNAIEHEQGYLGALSPAGDIDRERAPSLPPVRWRLVEQGLAIKQYPVCYRAHRAIDAMLGLVRDRGLRADAVRAITVRFSPSHSVILKNHRPRTAIDAKFSIEFALACALVAGRVGLRDLVDEFVLSEPIQRLVPRVSIEIESEEMPGTSGYAPYDLVRVETAAGEVIESAHVRHARGDPQAPLSADALWTKFEDCALWSGLPLDARALFDRLNALERCGSAAELLSQREDSSIGGRR
ncbi:MmgE/PrpD family protein [Pigmentiphaga sp.]|uniref:MmgE/PrpD family protein n=1 Tax=Pigmentiphaga sp. TaxID=1977564 RepID=UPI0025DD7EF0|nr:MmgE/PrpD family protein [Pigmentiphaga sp.]